MCTSLPHIQPPLYKYTIQIRSSLLKGLSYLICTDLYNVLSLLSTNTVNYSCQNKKAVSFPFSPHTMS